MTKYPVNNIYSCVQGEGVQTGVAMVLLRLHGCDVGCPWCDTKETWYFEEKQSQTMLSEALGENSKYVYLPPETIGEHIIEHHTGPRWVLVTGGEPAQYDLQPLVLALHGHGFKVAIETSGTERGHLDASFDWICVSPKLDMPGGKSVLMDVIASAHEIKHIVGKQKDIEALENLLDTSGIGPHTQICLQPVSRSPKATKLCIETVQQRGWRLSVQTHKYLDIP